MVALSYYCTKPAQKCLGFGLNSSVGESPHQHPWGQHPAPSPQAEAPVGTVLLRLSPHIPPAPGPGTATQGTSAVCPGGCGTNRGGADPLARGGTWGCSTVWGYCVALSGFWGVCSGAPLGPACGEH